ncbi:MAG: nucleotidyl transferase AbiEii/AbiGii toxin family protein [Thermoplasmataceae archaeon]
MIDVRRLREIGKIKGLTNPGQMEKDYFQELLMLAIFRNNENGLVFKGGTCLYKLYSLDRFSEDLDFDGVPDARFRSKITSFLKNYGYASKITTHNAFGENLSEKILIAGPLYSGTNESRCRIILDFSSRERPIIKPSVVPFYSHYDDLPSFPVLSLDLSEILAEKIRSLIHRKKARDLYDINFLLRKGVMTSLDIVNIKLRLNNIVYSEIHLRQGISTAQHNWNKELRAFVKDLQPVEPVENFVLESLIRMLKT